MLARCPACDRPFVTSSYGAQRCPKCGADVVLDDPLSPPGETPPGPPPSARPAPPPSPVPWERRSELGTWPALVETVKLVLFDPQRFFANLRYDSAEGVHLYFFLTAVVPQMLGTLLFQLSGAQRQQFEQLQRVYEQAGQEEAARGIAEAARVVESLSGPGVVAAVLLLLPPITFASLYLFAGLAHGILLLLGKAQGDFTATLKVFAYSGTPGLFSILPSCGPLLYWGWATVLQIMGLAPAHRATAGTAAVAVFGFHFVLLCCFCGVPALTAAGAMAAAGAG
jgi:hypothetical protein